MEYHVQKGDTIARVTNLMKMNWENLQRLNPQAVGRSSRTGNWFLKEGAVIKGKESFESVLRQQQEVFKPTSNSENSNESKGWTEYTIKPGDTLWHLAVNKFHVHVEDLIKDNGIEDPAKLKIGQKIRVRQSEYPDLHEVVASWYGNSYHGRLMADGNVFNMYADTIAHKDLPFGVKVELENPETGERARAIVTDRGPYIAGRDIDLSYGLAQKLSLVKKGVGKLNMRIIG